MPVTADVSGLIWVVIVVGSIIAQVMKAKKNAASPPPKKSSPRPEANKGEYTSSSDDLRNFLESIGAAPPTRNQERQRKIEPVAPPPPPRPIQVMQEVQTVPPPPPIPVRAQIKHRPSPMEEARKLQFKGDVLKRQTANKPNEVQLETPEQLQPRDQSSSGLAKLITEELQDLDATRKAIVLREILGPPIALR